MTRARSYAPPISPFSRNVESLYLDDIYAANIFGQLSDFSTSNLNVKFMQKRLSQRMFLGIEIVQKHFLEDNSWFPKRRRSLGRLWWRISIALTVCL